MLTFEGATHFLSNTFGRFSVAAMISYNFERYSDTDSWISSRNGGTMSAVNSSSGMALRNLKWIIFLIHFVLAGKSARSHTSPHICDKVLVWRWVVCLDSARLEIWLNFSHPMVNPSTNRPILDLVIRLIYHIDSIDIIRNHSQPPLYHGHLVPAMRLQYTRPTQM